MNNRFGFTLIELIVVITIIGILSTIGFSSYVKIQKTSRASRMAADFQQIELAWKVWKNANDKTYPLDAPTNRPPCGNVDALNVSATGANLYLDQKYKDPWGEEYMYDNDGDTYSGGNILAGVNLIAWWCPGNGQKYIEVAAIMDKSIDNGDGPSTGKLRWSTNPNFAGGIVFMIARALDQ